MKIRPTYHTDIITILVHHYFIDYLITLRLLVSCALSPDLGMTIVSRCIKILVCKSYT